MAPALNTFQQCNASEASPSWGKINPFGVVKIFGFMNDLLVQRMEQRVSENKKLSLHIVRALHADVK